MERKNLKLCLILVLIVGAALVPNTRTGAETQGEDQKAVTTAIFDTALDQWIDKLVLLESNGKENIKHLDSNGRYSYSCLQFQMGTFKEFYPLLKRDLPASWEAAIMDCGTQKALAKAMIEDNPSAWRHWFTSVKTRGLGLPPQI